MDRDSLGSPRPLADAMTRKKDIGYCSALLVICFTLSCAFGGVSGANANQICGKRSEIVSQLNDRFMEVPAWVGAADTVRLELFLARDGQTWTLLLSQTKEISCVVGAGNAWEWSSPTTHSTGSL